MRGKIAVLTELVIFITELVISALTLQAQTRTSFRVLLGVTDSTSNRWDGTITVKEAGNYSLDGWRFEDQDDIDGDVAQAEAGQVSTHFAL